MYQQVHGKLPTFICPACKCVNLCGIGPEVIRKLKVEEIPYRYT